MRFGRQLHTSPTTGSTLLRSPSALPPSPTPHSANDCFASSRRSVPDTEPGLPGIADLLRKSLQFSPLALASAVSMANSFAIALAFAHLANPTSYGTYQLAFAIVGVAAIFALSGSSTAAVRAAAQGRAAAFSLFVNRLPYAAATAAALLA